MDTFWWEVNDCKNHLTKASIGIAIPWCSLGIKIIEATAKFCFVLQIFQVWFLCKGQLNYIQSAFFCHLFPMVLLSCKLLLQKNLQTFDEKARQILPHNLFKNFFSNLSRNYFSNLTGRMNSECFQPERWFLLIWKRLQIG